MEKIDTTKIRGRWEEYGSYPSEAVNIKTGEVTPITLQGNAIAGGDDTIQSIKMVAEKVNEIIEWIESKKDQPL